MDQEAVLGRYFIRYALPGFNLLAFGVVVPILRLDPDAFRSISTAEAILLVSAGLVAGFLLDSLRLYNFVRGYKEISDPFFLAIAQEFGRKSVKDGRQIFERFWISAPEKVLTRLRSSQERWVMLLHSSRVFLAGAILWVVVLALHVASLLGEDVPRLDVDDLPENIALDVGLFVLYVLVSSRLADNGKQVQKDTNDNLLQQIRLYRPDPN